MSVIPRSNGTTLVVGSLPVRDTADRGFYRGVGDELARIVVGRRGALGLRDISREEQRAHDAYAALAGDDEGLPLAMRILNDWRKRQRRGINALIGRFPDDLWPFFGQAEEKHCARHLAHQEWRGDRGWHGYYMNRLITARYHQSAYRRTSYGHASFDVNEGSPLFRGSTESHNLHPGLHRSTLFMRVRDYEKWYTDIYLAGLSLVNGALVADRITDGRTTWLVAGKQAPGYAVTTRLLRKTGAGSNWQWIGKEESLAIITSARHEDAAA